MIVSDNPANLLTNKNFIMKHQRPKRSEYVHIKDVLSEVVRHCRKESDTALFDIRKTWNTELDKTFTDHAQPTALKGGTLLITVKSSTLTHQLRFLTEDIIRMINRNSVNYRISDLKIKTGNF